MILFILYEFVSNKHKGASGGNISNYLLIESLRHHKKIGILAPNISKELTKELEEKGVLVITEDLKFKTPFKRFKKRQWIKGIINKKILNSADTMSDLEIIVSSNGTSDLTAELQTENTKIFILCRAFEDFFNHNSYYPLKEKIKRSLIKVLSAKKISAAYRSADRIVTNSDYMKCFIQSHYSKVDISILYPPIDIPLKSFKPLPCQPRVGIINPSSRKGENIFLALAKKNPELKFLYFSNTPKKYALDNIEYAGWFSDREELFSHIDLLIAPSVWTEPFGRVSVEAIRSGIPVLVSNVGGLPETVDDEFIVCNQSTDSWENKLNWIINNPSEVKIAWNKSALKSKKFEQLLHNENALKSFSWQN